MADPSFFFDTLQLRSGFIDLSFEVTRIEDYDQLTLLDVFVVVDQNLLDVVFDPRA